MEKIIQLFTEHKGTENVKSPSTYCLLSKITKIVKAFDSFHLNNIKNI